tara:strand:- start:493 stop:675 length:183 start_codon:yes stop_codon:yes gene_type:complete
VNKQQIRWASQHDWFVSSECIEGEGVVTVIDYISSETQPELYLTHPVFTDYKELKEWAGY